MGVPSPSGAEADAVRALREALRGRPVRSEVDAAGSLHLVAGDGAKRLLLLGHIDTVPGGPDVHDDGTFLHGRGAVDAKGPLCAASAALACAAEAGSLGPDWTVRLVAAVGEEAPGSPGARRLLEDLDPPDAMIVLEPSGWDAVTLGYKGHLRVRLHCERSSAHSAGPESSAADRLVRAAAEVLGALEREAATGGGAFARLTGTILRLASAHDGGTERAEATVGLRLPPERGPDDVRAWLEERLAGHDVRLTADDAVPAVRGAADGPLPRAFRVAIRGQGGTPRRVVKTGTSDWNVVASRWRVPTLAYGPGDAAYDHAPDERIAWSAYEAGVRVLHDVLGRITNDGAA